MNVSDAPLVQRALAGDTAAFGLLVERHRPTLLRLAARMLGDAAEAEDAAQEACLHAFLGLGRLRDPERFGAWLYGIAVNLCRLRLRARRDWYSLDDWDGGRVASGFKWPDAQPSPEAAYEIRELHATILNAIALLPREQQAVVRLHYLDGLTLGEIGVLAGSPLGTVKARLHRARERLRAELAHEFAPSASRKEKSRMIEVTVKDVVTQTRADRDVLEANAREAPPPEAQEVRQPLPPGMPGFPRVVLLKEKSGERLLPIWIGPWEGDIIALQLAGKSALRPLTHELTVRLLEAAQLALEQVAVTRLHEECFYATLWVRTKGGQAQEIDARPSDALALALRLNVPIFVAEEVMDSQGVEPERFDEKLAGDQPDAAAPARWVSVPAPDMDKPKK